MSFELRNLNSRFTTFSLIRKSFFRRGSFFSVVAKIW